MIKKKRKFVAITTLIDKGIVISGDTTYTGGIRIDGEMIGREKSLIFERCRDILAQHYSNPDTWTNMCEYLQ